VSREALEAVLGSPLAGADAAAPRASGTLARHYAPRTPLEVVALAELPARIAACAPEPVAVLAPAWAAAAEPHVRLHILAPETAEGYAAGLYAALRRLDASGARRLLVAQPPAGPAWEAVRDRLKRASAGSAT
jgi:L-threonylcarbamoyladenylate synthase